MKKLYILSIPEKLRWKNIDKMINCGDPSLAALCTPAPTAVTSSLFHSAVTAVFAPPAATNMPWSAPQVCLFKLVSVQHRHCVFTIDENLRDFFLQDRSLLDCLFHSVSSVISRMFFNLNHAKNFTPGYIMVLHTFGRDLK